MPSGAGHDAMMLALDENVGRVRQKLADTGLEKNTFIIFISDNGHAEIEKYDTSGALAAGFTPLGMGNKDGYGGAWFFSLIGKQNLDSIDQLKDAMIGKADFADPKYSGFYQALADLKAKGYLPSDVASIRLVAGVSGWCETRPSSSTAL